AHEAIVFLAKEASADAVFTQIGSSIPRPKRRGSDRPTAWHMIDPIGACAQDVAKPLKNRVPIFMASSKSGEIGRIAEFWQYVSRLFALRYWTVRERWSAPTSDPGTAPVRECRILARSRPSLVGAPLRLSRDERT